MDSVIYVLRLASIVLGVSLIMSTKDKVVVLFRKDCEIFNASECTVQSKLCVTGA